MSLYNQIVKTSNWMYIVFSFRNGGREWGFSKVFLVKSNGRGFIGSVAKFE